MKQMRKVLALVLTAVMALSLLAGCGNNAQQAEAPAATEAAVAEAKTETEAPAETKAATSADEISEEEKGNTLTVWLYESFNDDSNQFILERAEQFADEFDVDFEYEWVNDQTYLTKYNAAVEAGTLPDVSYMRGDYVKACYPNLYLYDLTDFLNELNKTNAFLEEPVEIDAIDGKHYILPMFSSAHPAVYRKDLFEEAGYSEFPDTWEGLRDACIKISELHPDIAGFGIGCGVNENEGEQVLRWMMWDYGGGLFDKDGNVNANCEENKKAWQIYVDMWKAGAIPADAASWDAGSNNANYLQQTVAMTFNAYTILSALAGEGYEELNDLTGVSMVPSGPAGCYIDDTCYGYSIFNTTESPETAMAFLKYISDADWYSEWIMNTTPVYSPTVKSVAETGYWVEEPGCITTEFCSHGVCFGYPGTDIETMSKGSQVFNSYKVNEAMSKIITDGATVDEALDWLQAELEGMF